MEINRVWAMRSRYTFTIKPVNDLIKRYVNNHELWVDPFSGKSQLVIQSNDIDKKMPSMFHLDALEFLLGFGGGSVSGVLLDPPFSPAQAKWCYDVNKFKRNTEFWKHIAKCKRQAGFIIKKGGIAISFGFNSGGIGKKYGFELLEILLIAHGGNVNDTIVTVEKKVS